MKIKTVILLIGAILILSVFVSATSYSPEIKTQEKNNLLVNIDKIVEDNSLHTLTTRTKNKDEGAPSPSSTSLETNFVSIALYDEGKKEIEGKIPTSFEGEIKKTESLIEGNKKEVTIKSDEHLESPLIVYTDIEETNNKESIRVYWKNEENSVEIKYYLDTNNNGLIDRIGWTVPHLSEQVFEITVDSSKDSDSNEISITISNIKVTKPFSFELDVDYNGSVDCLAGIDDTPSYPVSFSGTQTLEEEKDLQNGNHEIRIYCEDSTNPSVNLLETEGFVVAQEEFEIGDLDNYYLLGNEVDFTFNYPLASFIEIINPDNAPIASYLISCGTLDCSTGGVGTNLVGNYLINISTDYYEKRIYSNKDFNIVDVSITPYTDSININEETNFTVEFDTIISPSYIVLDYKDGTTNTEYNAPTPIYPTDTIVFTKTYTSSGTYIPELTFELDGKEFSVPSPEIEVIDPSTENEAPEVNLIYPDDNEIIKSDTITFRYSANDDKKISSCEYELYIIGDELKELEYKTTDTTITLGQENEVRMTEFDDGRYSWYINCKDNQSKSTEETRDFVVQTTKHENEDEINEAMDALEDFLEKESSLTLDEKNALDELGISDDLIYYSKRLVQIDQDLGNNLKYITDTDLRESRIEETIEELNEIITKIPTNIEIIDSAEYVKNTLTADMEEITKQYAEGKNIQLTPKEIKRLAENNELIQQYLSTSTTIKKIEIDYKLESKIITSIKKDLTFNGEDNKIILEQLPSEFEGLQFTTQSSQLTKTLFEINRDDLDEDVIIYYIEGDLDLEDLKKTETVLFEESSPSSGSITGYFSAPLSDRNSLIFIIIFIGLVLFAAIFGKDIFKKMQMNIWKKEENVKRILDYSQKAKKSLQSEDQEIAKEYYHKIKEIYPLVPEGFRKHSYTEIKKIRIGIDKRDMMNFVREYEKAKREKREEDVKRIYENIREQYKKLPEKHQQKVYERVIKDQVKNDFSL